jgi:hypothetical protein
MADKRRFDRFANFLCKTFPDAERVWDIAGGQGALSQALLQRGRQATTFDNRWKHLPVPYRQELLTPELPCEADLLAGLHADDATRIIIEYAALHGLPFAVVPCCSDNSLSYKPWVRHLHELALELGMPAHYADLGIDGRSTVVWSPGVPLDSGSVHRIGTGTRTGPGTGTGAGPGPGTGAGPGTGTRTGPGTGPEPEPAQVTSYEESP